MSMAVHETGVVAGIRMRVSRFAGEIHDIATKLEQHAVSIHGSAILGNAAKSIEGVGENLRDKLDGELPQLHTELDKLEGAIARIAHAAGLNTTLA